MELDPNLKLNKKDEKEINGFLQSFKKGLITGTIILAGFFAILIIIEFIKWLK